MRASFIKTIIESARVDSRIVLCTAEVGFSLIEPFQDEFPDRYYNVGIAEQNLVGVSAGLALRGLRPVALSMASFLPGRAFEQVKVLIGIQKLPVVLVGAGTGLTYGGHGPTHHAIEDLAIASAIPNMTVFCPCDAHEVSAVTVAALELDGPSYLAIGRNGEPKFHENKLQDFLVGQASFSSLGSDAIIFTTGIMAIVARQAIEILKEEGFSVGLVHSPTVKPLDISKIVLEKKAIFILDEHTTMGGFCDAVTRVAVASGNGDIHVLGIPDVFADTAASRESLQKNYGIDVNGVVKTVKSVLLKKK